MKDYSSLKLNHPPCALFAYGPPKMFFGPDRVHPVWERSFLYYLTLLRVCQKKESAGYMAVQMRATAPDVIKETWVSKLDPVPCLTAVNPTSLSVGVSVWWSSTPEGYGGWSGIYNTRYRSAGTKKEVMEAINYHDLPSRLISGMCKDVELFADLLDDLQLISKGKTI